MIHPLEILLRLLVAAGFGAMVGLERERRDQPAGLRTHIILSIGASLAMILSIELASQFREVAPNGDPARLAAQVISGIGFLGAGAIIRYGPNIKGLTTATSLWTIAVISLAVGAGHFIAAGTAIVLLLIALGLLGSLEKRYIHSIITKTIRLKVHDSARVWSRSCGHCSPACLSRSRPLGSCQRPQGSRGLICTGSSTCAGRRQPRHADRGAGAGKGSYQILRFADPKKSSVAHRGKRAAFS